MTARYLNSNLWRAFTLQCCTTSGCWYLAALALLFYSTSIALICY